MNTKTRLTFLLPVLLAVGGCTTIRSTMLNRTEQDQYIANDHATRGVPITLRVPTHLDVKIVETYFLKNHRDGTDFVDLQPMEGYTYCTVETDLISTDKVFTVDFARPASGTLDYEAEFANQYFSKINNKLEDTTIRDTADLVATAATLFGIPGAGAAPAAAAATAFTGTSTGDDQVKIGSNLSSVIAGKRVVAYRRFDIDSCNFENDVNKYVEPYLAVGGVIAHGAESNVVADVPVQSVPESAVYSDYLLGSE